MKQIVVACGSGVATSQTVASKVNRLLKENNIPAEVLAVDIKSVDRYIAGSCAYIAITKVRKEYPIPVINGIAFLTGVGQDAEFKKVYDFNKKAKLPCRLADLELDMPTMENYLEAVTKMGDISHNPYQITVEMLRAAFVKLEAMN